MSERGMPPRRRLFALTLLAPSLLLGIPLLSGARFLPQLPVVLEPLASERPDEAAAARANLSYGPSDRIFPALSDQLVMHTELAHLDLPTWEPDLGLGAPLFANSIAGPCYPPNWLGLAVAPDLAAGPLAWLSLVLAGLGMALFLSRAGFSAGAVAVGVLGVQLGGWGAANLLYPMKVDAALYLAWSLFAIEGMARGARRSALVLFLSVACSLLAGFPPIALFSIATAAAYALVRASSRGAALLGAPQVALGGGATAGEGGLDGLFFLARVAIVLVLGAAGGAWQLLPTAEASRESLRQGNTAEDLRKQTLPAATLAGVIVPDFVGAPDEPPLRGGTPVAWWIAGDEDWQKVWDANALEWNTFAGIGLVLLAAAALAAAPRRAAVPAAGLLLVYGFALGWPLVRLLYHVPGLNAGSPNRALAVAWVLWPWLAAVGADALFAGKVRARAALLAVAAAALAGAGWTALAFDPAAWGWKLLETLHERYSDLPDPPTEAEVAEVVPPEAAIAAGERLLSSARLVALVAGLSAAAALGLGARRIAKLGPLAFGALLLAEGALTAHGHWRFQEVGPAGLFPPSPALEAVHAAAGDGRVIRYDASPSESRVADVEQLARPNLPQVYRIADLTPWTLFTPRRLVELVEELDPLARWRSGISRVSDPALLDRPLYDLLRVTCVLSRTPLAHPRLSPVFEREGFHVYHRSGALPPARIVAAGLEVPSDEVALGLLAQGSVPFAEQALLAPGTEARPSAPRAAEAVIELVARPAKNRLDLKVRASRGGLLVMHEQYFPGWKATINGADADILRVDHVYRGLWLPEGDLVIRTWYEPWSLRIGFALTLAALAAAAWFALRRGW